MPSLSSTSTPKCFSTGLLSNCSSPSLSVVMFWIALTKVGDITLCWTSGGLHEPTSQDPSGWHSFPTIVSTAPLSLALFTNLLRVHLIPHSVSLMEISSSTAPSMNPWGTPLFTGLHLDIEPLTSTLWMWPSSQLLIHQHVLVTESQNHKMAQVGRDLWRSTSPTPQTNRIT